MILFGPLVFPSCHCYRVGIHIRYRATIVANSVLGCVGLFVLDVAKACVQSHTGFRVQGSWFRVAREEDLAFQANEQA